MRKADEAAPTLRATPGDSTQARKPGVARVLNKRTALIADINHALLVRKGIRGPRQLRWVLGPVISEGVEPLDAQSVELPEEILEALQGLLGCAVGEEANLRNAHAHAGEEMVKVEAFLLQLVVGFGSLEVLQARVDAALTITRFPSRAEVAEQELRVALGAVSSVMNSSAVPVLLEGVLLLGNSVNSSSRQLGGAVGVTLESLAKLAHTRCLPPDSVKECTVSDKKGQSENALHVLVMHLEQARPSFAESLSRDLEPCNSARDFDPKVASCLIDELSKQVHSIRLRSRAADAETSDDIHTLDAMAPERLRQFLDTAVPKLDSIKELLQELDEATVALRQWFAEPAESSLQGMLHSLASLRDALPGSRPVKRPGVVAATTPQNGGTRAKERPRRSSRARKSGEATSTPAIDKASARPGTASSPELVTGPDMCARLESKLAPEAVPQEEVSAKTDEHERVVANGPQEADAEDLSKPLHEAPFQVVVQILSFKQGTIWLNWSFNWTIAPVELPGVSGAAHCFEVLQRCSSKTGDIARWRCLRPPVKFDVPVGFCYEFEIRALLTRGEGGDVLWSSNASAATRADLQGVAQEVERKKGEVIVEAHRNRSKSSFSSDTPTRRPSVAASIGALLGGSQSPTLKIAGEPQRAVPSRSAPGEAAAKGKEVPALGTVESELPAIKSDEPAGSSAAAAPSSDPANICPDGGEQGKQIAQEQGLKTQSKIFREPSFDDDFLANLARAFSSVERIKRGSSYSSDFSYSEYGMEKPMGFDVSSRTPETPSADSELLATKSDAAETSEPEISEMDDDSLRYLARALTNLDGFVAQESTGATADTRHVARTISSTEDFVAQEFQERGTISYPSRSSPSLPGSVAQERGAVSYPSTSSPSLPRSSPGRFRPDANQFTLEQSECNLPVPQERLPMSEGSQPRPAERFQLDSASSGNSTFQPTMARAVDEKMFEETKLRRDKPVRGAHAVPSSKSAVSSQRPLRMEQELPDGNEVFENMQRRYSTPDDLAGCQGASFECEAANSKVPLEMVDDASESEELQDGNAVLAAVEAQYKSKSTCKLCNGSGQVGMLGANGLGFFKRPCQCKTQGPRAQNASESYPALPKSVSTSKPPQTLTATPKWAAPASREASYREASFREASFSTSKPAPLLAAPFWAAQPSRQPSDLQSRSDSLQELPVSSLKVHFADGKDHVLQFSGRDDLPQLVEKFAKEHHLRSLFINGLLEVVRRMQADGVSDNSVDIADLF